MTWREQAGVLKRLGTDAQRDALLDRLKTTAVLYIDDLFKTAKGTDGVQRPSEAEVRLAFEIINSRYAAKKKTIISSESLMADIVKIDEAIAGRIKQMCGYYLVNIPTATAERESRNHRMRGA